MLVGTHWIRVDGEQPALCFQWESVMLAKFVSALPLFLKNINIKQTSPLKVFGILDS